MDLVGKNCQSRSNRASYSPAGPGGFGRSSAQTPQVSCLVANNKGWAIARALANEPHILVADEPTGNLDSQTTAQIYHIFEDLHRAGQTIITVTHEQMDIAKYDAVYQMHDGRVSPFKPVSEA